MKDYYVFPAILKESKKEFILFFPVLDLEIRSENLLTAIKNAKQELSKKLYELEEKKEPIPEASKLKDIKTDDKIFFIEANLKLYREVMKNKSVTRAVTLPKYLNDLVKESELNVSAVLQEALKEKLGITE